MSLARSALVLVLAVVVLVGALWLIQRRLIYFPDPAPVPPAAAVIAGAQDVTLETSDGLRLDAWLVPPAGATDQRVGVLMAPGNAGNRAVRAPLAVALSRAGLTVLLLEYRGYGGNPGAPSEKGLAHDARAARAYLAGRADRLIYFGESLGAAVVTALAVEHPPAGLVLRSPFASLTAVGRHHYPYLPVGALLRDRYPVADLVAAIPAPTVVIYGTRDAVVPPEQSRRVAASAAGPVREVAIQGADHNDPVLFNGPEVIEAVVRLARQSVTG
jgi:pimeloyl-ACP methyl ester carboxylesterase